MDCIFCKIVQGEIPSYKIYEDEYFLAFLSIKPVNLGHTLIVPKAHFTNLFDLPVDLLEKLGPVIQKVGLAVKDGTVADGLNLGMNNGEAAGQAVFHAHLHLMPRFKNDGYEDWHGKEGVPPEAFKQTQTKIAGKIR